jgi:hypothetical protein
VRRRELFFAASVARPFSRYQPGFRRLPPTRLRNSKRLFPASPRTANEPLTPGQRMQRRRLALERLALTHRLPTLRPIVFRCTEKRTVLGSERVKATCVPVGTPL